MLDSAAYLIPYSEALSIDYLSLILTHLECNRSICDPFGTMAISSKNTKTACILTLQKLLNHSIAIKKLHTKFNNGAFLY